MTAPTEPTASVVIPARNAAPLLGEQLDSLVAQDSPVPFEVLVVDNGSSDDTAAMAQRWRGRLDLRVIDARDGVGVSYARNAGVREARSDLILLCDADDQVSPQWVRRMVEALERYDHVGGPRRLDRLNAPHVVAWYPAHPTDRLSGGDGFLPWAVGANCGFRREVFDAVDGYFEGLILGGDDLDFSWRAQLAGFSIGFAHDAWIDYRLRPSLRTLYRQTKVRSRGAAILHERFRAHGMAPSRRSVARTTWWLGSRLPLALVSRNRRGVWIRTLAALHGRLLR